jgi:hypothetical protein
MAEVLTNGTFTGSITGWSKWGGSSREMFIYDATGASHDGGSARARHIGDPLTTVRFSMYQNITLTNASAIDTATMTAWCQWNDAWPAAQSEVSKSYVEFNVTLKDPDGNFHYIKNATRYFGSLTALALMTDYNVKSHLQAGGNGTWEVIFAVNIYRANITDGWFVAWYDDLAFDITYYDYGSEAETITLSDATSSSIDASDTEVDTITLSDSTALSVSADPTIRYYFGTYDGKVYAEDSAYKGDAGESIDAYWESKETDFAEESADSLDRFKTVYKIRLWYVDISSTTAVVTMSIKADGGATWTEISENVGGSGDDTNKCKDFYIIKSGHTFKFRVEHDSSSNEFQWTAIEVYYTLGGDYYQ